MRELNSNVLQKFKSLFLCLFLLKKVNTKWVEQLTKNRYKNQNIVFAVGKRADRKKNFYKKHRRMANGHA